MRSIEPTRGRTNTAPALLGLLLASSVCLHPLATAADEAPERRPDLPDLIAVSIVLAEEARLSSSFYRRLDELRESAFQMAVELENERRRAAREERADLEETLLPRLRLEVEQQRWALSLFEPRRRGLITAPERPSALLERWQRSRDLARQKYTTLPERSRGEVASGRALNFFLATCGAVALQHQLQREHMESQLALARAQSPPNEELIARIELRQHVLDELLLADEAVTSEDAGRIQVVFLSLGEKLPVPLNGRPLELQWPVAVRLNDEFDACVARITAVRDDMVGHLEQGEPVPTDLVRNLMQGVDELSRLVDKHCAAHFKGVRKSLQSGGRINPQDGLNLQRARLFAQRVRADAYRLLEARSLDDVRPPEFHGGSIADLMAHCARHGLEFAPAGNLDLPTYDRLYKLMVDYYFNLRVLEESLATNELDVDRYLERIDDLFTIEYRDTLSALGDGDAFAPHGGNLGEALGTFVAGALLNAAAAGDALAAPPPAP